jgi:transposase
MGPDPPETALDTSTEVARSEVRRLEVLGQMTGRRRFWSVDQKLGTSINSDYHGAEVFWALRRI